MASGKVVSRTTVQHVTRDEHLDPTFSARITEFSKKVEVRLNNQNFVNPAGNDMYIDDIDGADAAAHGDGSNTPTDKNYGDMITEARPEIYNIDSDIYNKYIVAEVMMDVPGEGPQRETVKHRVEGMDDTIGGTFTGTP